MDGLQAWYTPSELAQILNRSRWQVCRELAPILRQPHGPKTMRRVYVSQLPPEIYDSLRVMLQARRLTEAADAA
jgi:phage baseplate assembly protein W